VAVWPVTASAAFQSPRAFTAASACAVCRSSAPVAGTAAVRPSARSTPRTSGQPTWLDRETETSRCAKRTASRRDGGVGSGSVRAGRGRRGGAVSGRGLDAVRAGPVTARRRVVAGRGARVGARRGVRRRRVDRSGRGRGGIRCGGGGIGDRRVRGRRGGGRRV